jgi:hypothetical protein
VNDLIGASKEYATLNDILDKDVEHDCVKKQGSHSRNLRRVRLGLGLIKALFEQFLETEYVSHLLPSSQLTTVCRLLHPLLAAAQNNRCGSNQWWFSVARIIALPTDDSLTLALAFVCFQGLVV